MKFKVYAFGCIPLLVLAAVLLGTCASPEGDGSDLFAERRVAFDPDLYGWKTASWFPFTVSDTISGFAWGRIGGADRYVAVSRSGIIAWSSDGDKWEPAKKVPDDIDNSVTLVNPFNASFNAVAYGGGLFIAVANGGKIAWSTDGIAWTAGGHSGEIPGFGTEDIKGIAYGDGLFIAVGGKANIASSPNAVSWTGGLNNNPAFNAITLHDIAYSENESTFYIVGDAGTTGYSKENPFTFWNHYQYSNGSGAKTDTGYPFFGNPIRKIALGKYGSDAGIALIFDEWGGRRHAFSTTENFRNADSHDWDADIDAGMFGNNSFGGIAWGGGNFVMAGTSAMVGWWPAAEPGKDSQRYWRALSFREFEWWEITALAACKDRFFVGGIGGKIGYSK